MVAYAYLWNREAEAGQEEGLKDRPVVVVLAKMVAQGRTQLLVAPVTHREPPRGEGVLIPAAVKRQLGLDDEPSWIVTTELNRFIWPGPDIRLAKGADSPVYGAIPARLFEAVRRQILGHRAATSVDVVRRTE